MSQTLREFWKKVVVPALEKMPAAAAAAKGPALKSLLIGPGKVTVTAGKPQQFTATGVYADKTKRDLTQTVAWQCFAVEPIMMSIDAKGLVTLQEGSGIVTIAATEPVSGIEASIQIRVKSPVPVAQAIKIMMPARPNERIIRKSVGAGFYFYVAGTLPDGSNQDLSRKAQLSTSDSKTVAIEKDGKCHARGPGTAKITAKDPASGLEDSLEVEVAKPITVRAPKTVVGGGTFRFWAEGDPNSDPEDGDIRKFKDTKKSVVWSATPANIIEFDQEGQATALKPGEVTITAKDPNSGFKDSAKVKIIEPGPGARKTDVHIMVQNFKRMALTNMLTRVVFNASHAEDVTAHGEIKNGLLKFASLWLMPEGTMLFAEKSMANYKLPASGVLTFKAVEEAKTKTVRAKSKEEAAKHAGARGSIDDMEFAEVGGLPDAQGETEWEVTWGTSLYDIKQV